MPAPSLVDWDKALRDVPDPRVQAWLAIAEQPLTVTLVANTYSNGKNHTTTVESFFRKLTRPYQYSFEKRKTPGFAPCELIDDADAKNAEDKNLEDENVRCVTLLVADFEREKDYLPTVADIRAPLDERGLAFVIKTSFSHDPDGPKGPRFRAIVPLAEPIFVGTPIQCARYEEAYVGLRDLFGWHHDRSCRNPARFYYDGWREQALAGVDAPLKGVPRKADGGIDILAITARHSQTLAEHRALDLKQALVIFQPGKAF